MAGPGYVTDLVIVPEQNLLLEVQIIAGGGGREVGVSIDLARRRGEVVGVREK